MKRFWASWGGVRKTGVPVPFEAWLKPAPNVSGDMTDRFYAVVEAETPEAVWAVIANAFRVDEVKFCSFLGARKPCPHRFPEKDRIQ